MRGGHLLLSLFFPNPSMPTVNIYYKSAEESAALGLLADKLKAYLASELTCSNIKLDKHEISLRLVKVDPEGSLGEVELDITAHAFPERIERQDAICRNTKRYLEKVAPSLGDIRVWLHLCQLGHDVLDSKSKD
jgi:hypothetical protein